MSDPQLRGVVPIIDAPFHPDGAVDEAGLESLCGTLIAADCDALALFGYASEFYKLTADERDRMAGIVIDACTGSDVPAICSVTAQSTYAASREAERYTDRGADALMLLPPYERDPPTDAIYEHLVTVADATDLPIIVQYAPGSTGVTLPPSFFADLYHEAPTIDHFKIECDPAGPYVGRLHDLTDDGAEVFVGRAGYEMIEAYDRGAVGVMPASAMHDIYVTIDRAYRAGDRDRAVEVHSDLVAVLNQLTKVGIAWEKRILADRGIVASAHCREPEATFDDTYDRLYEEYYERYLEPHFDDSTAGAG
jgi:2-keto-3-deoxy-L-arabinonate dehydratase